MEPVFWGKVGIAIAACKVHFASKREFVMPSKETMVAILDLLQFVRNESCPNLWVGHQHFLPWNLPLPQARPREAFVADNLTTDRSSRLHDGSAGRYIYVVCRSNRLSQAPPMA
jgi:hypothetical protein